MKDLKDKVAVITGAAAGIGAAMASHFAAEGMRVILVDRDAGGVQDAAHALREKGYVAHPIAIDVTLEGAVEELADEVYRDFKAVHLLANNAGVLGRVQPSWEQPFENWHWVFDVNFFGVVHGIHYFVPRMLAANEEGYILNTASIAGMLTGPFFAPYNASKHAVIALSECLHHELRAVDSKIEVGVLCPGWVNTGLADFEKKLPDELRKVNEKSSVHPIAEERDRSVRQMVSESVGPEQIAEIVVAAVKQGSFYIYPHPERKADVQQRMEGMLAERIPSFGPPKK